MAERERVENPFTMGTSTGRTRFKPDLASRARSRQSFDKGAPDGAFILDGLVKFAGVAGDEYVKQTAKTVEADKAVQTSLAVQGLTYSDKATTAGFRAHAAVAIKGKTLAAQARLNELAKNKTTDEEWEEAIREEYRVMDESLMSSYQGYGKDIELQKLSAVALRETIPQVTATREGYKIEHEINDRINAATDVLMNGSSAGLLAISDPKELVSSVNAMLAPLQLTASQKDKVIEDAIVASGDQALVELAKSFKGDRDTTLFSRSGKIQSIDLKNTNQNIANNSIDLMNEKRALETGLLGGDGVTPSMTVKEFTDIVKRRNKELNNKFMTAAQYDSMLDLRDKQVASGHVGMRIKEKIQNPNITNLDDEKKKDIQAAFQDLISTRMQQAQEEASKMSPEEGQKHIQNESLRTIATYGDQSVKSDTLVQTWLSDLHNLATLNIPANLLEGDVQGYTIEDLPAKAKQAMNLIEGLSPTAKDEYLDNMNDAGSAKTIKNFIHLKEMGVPLTVALDRAQFLTRNPIPVDFKAVTAGVAEVRENMEYYWWKKDVPDNQSDYLDQILKEKVMVDPNPESTTNTDMISRWMSTKWTTTPNGTRLQGTPEQLSSASGLHPSRIGNAMDAYIQAEKKRILPAISGLGLTLEDVFPVTDPKTQTMHLRTKFGAIVGSNRSMSDLPILLGTRKIELEKKRSDFAKRAVGADKTTVPSLTTFKRTPTD